MRARVRTYDTCRHHTFQLVGTRRRSCHARENRDGTRSSLDGRGRRNGLRPWTEDGDRDAPGRQPRGTGERCAHSGGRRRQRCVGGARGSTVAHARGRRRVSRRVESPNLTTGHRRKSARTPPAAGRFVFSRVDCAAARVRTLLCFFVFLFIFLGANFVPNEKTGTSTIPRVECKKKFKKITPRSIRVRIYIYFGLCARSRNP